jgi:hypothetical protein
MIENRLSSLTLFCFFVVLLFVAECVDEHPKKPVFLLPVYDSTGELQCYRDWRNDI